MFVTPAKQELVGHAGNVIANDDMARFRLRKFFVRSWHRTVSAQIVDKKLFKALHGAVAVLGDARMVVNVGEKEALKRTISHCRSIAEAGEAFWGPANAIHGGGTGGENALFSSFNKVGSQRIQNAFEGFVEYEFCARAAVRGIDLRVDIVEKRNFLAQNGEIQQLGFEGIVDIRGVVSNFVDPVDELRFEGRAQIKKIFGKLGKCRGGIIARMLDDAFANFKCEIESGKIEIPLLELFDDPQRVQIVIETAALRAH